MMSATQSLFQTTFGEFSFISFPNLFSLFKIFYSLR
nr:MAG TPA: hypothetical protein [Caudoviricetes sp.]